MKNPGEVAALVCIIIGTLIFCLGVFLQVAKADNMVCRDNGHTQIYIETSDLETPIDAKLKKLGAIRVSWISMGTPWNTIKTHAGNDWRVGNIIPCTMIVEKKNVTSSLKEYLSLTWTTGMN